MEILDQYGTGINILPSTALCEEEGKNPLEIDECPICQFDDMGEICVPELCEKYSEGL